MSDQHSSPPGQSGGNQSSSTNTNANDSSNASNEAGPSRHRLHPGPFFTIHFGPFGPTSVPQSGPPSGVNNDHTHTADPSTPSNENNDGARSGAPSHMPNSPNLPAHGRSMWTMEFITGPPPSDVATDGSSRSPPTVQAPRETTHLPLVGTPVHTASSREGDNGSPGAGAGAETGVRQPDESTQPRDAHLHRPNITFIIGPPGLHPHPHPHPGRPPNEPNGNVDPSQPQAAPEHDNALPGPATNLPLGIPGIPPDLAPFFNIFMPFIPGFTFSREAAPDPEKAAELLRSLPNVGQALLRRVDRIVAAEEADDGEEKGWKCGVCLEGVEDPTSPETGVKVLPCNHLFHGNCLEPWFASHHTWWVHTSPS